MSKIRWNTILAVSGLFSLLLQGCGGGHASSDVSLYIEPGLFMPQGSSGHQQYLARSGRYSNPLNRVSTSDFTDSMLFSSSSVASVRDFGTILATDGDLTPPVTCVGLNIMGENISSASSSEGSAAWSEYKGDLLSGETCSYPGKVSNVVSVNTGGVINVKVPFGANRVIQLVGYSGVSCNQGITGTNMLDINQVPGAYELGRSVTSLFSSKPSVEIEFDVSTVSQIDQNETSATVNEFVPDIRCKVKGEPLVQYNSLIEQAGENGGDPTPTPTPTPSPTPDPTPTPTPSPTPEPTPTPTPSPTPEPTPTPTPTPVPNGIECGADEAIVGIYGVENGDLLNRVGLICSYITASGVSADSYMGPAVGGDVGTGFNYECASGKVINRITGTNGSATYPNATIGQRYQCVNASGGGGAGISTTFGGSTGNEAFTFNCAAGEYAYGINIDTDGEGVSTTFTFGLKCRAVP